MDATHERSCSTCASGFLASVAAGDPDAVGAIYAPDAVIWHNNDDAEQSVDENLRVLRWATSRIAGFRYEDVRRTASANGFVEQHTLRGKAPNGEELRLPACIVCTVCDGRIERLDEYFDSAQLGALLRDNVAG